MTGKRRRKTNEFILAVLAVLLTLAAGLGSAWSYFTTYAEAKGGYTIELGDQTQISEEFSAWTKHVVITNEEGSQPVYIRVKAFCGSEYTLTYSDNGSGKWTPGDDGYYYYSDIVDAGGSADELLVQILNVPETDPEDFQVVVIYESTPVQYDEKGVAYANWDIRLDSGTSEGGGE